MAAGSELQALIDEADGPVHVPFGTSYTLTESLLVDPGLSLRVDGRIVRGWDAVDTRDAMIRNRDFSTPVDGFHLYGRGTITGGGRDGKVVMTLGDRMVFNGITVNDYHAGQAFYVAGDDMKFRRVKVRESSHETGTGAVRFTGGDRFRAVDCDMESGDDVYQVVPANSLTDPMFGLGASNVRYRRCRGRSWLGRLLIVFNDSNTVGAISDVDFRRCSGIGSNRGIVARNIGSGSVDDVGFFDCSLQMADPPYMPQNQDILIDGATNVLFRRLSFVANTRWYSIINGGSALFESCEFVGGTDPTA